MPESTQGDVKSSTRTLQILKLLSKYPSGLTFSELQRELSVPKSSLYVLLSTIQNEKWIEFNRYTSRYSLGIQAWESTQFYMNQNRLISIAEKHITEMMSDLHSSGHLAILMGCEVLYLAQIKTDATYDLPSRVGSRLPAQATALGKSLLTAFSERDISTMYKDYKFEKFNDHTIGSLEELLAEVRRVKTLGYSESNGEMVKSFYCVAAPIRDHTGSVIAALSSTVPIEYLNRKVVTKNKMRDYVKNEAAQVSAELRISS